MIRDLNLPYTTQIPDTDKRDLTGKVVRGMVDARTVEKAAAQAFTEQRKRISDSIAVVDAERSTSADKYIGQVLLERSEKKVRHHSKLRRNDEQR